MLKKSYLYFQIFVSMCGVTHGGSPIESDSINYTGCRMDFNNDGNIDDAIMIAEKNQCKLVALVYSKNGYTAYLLDSACSRMQVSCLKSYNIRGIPDGGRELKDTRIKTGAVIRLSQPEGASLGFYWEKGGFKQIWLSD